MADLYETGSDPSAERAVIEKGASAELINALHALGGPAVGVTIAQQAGRTIRTYLEQRGQTDRARIGRDDDRGTDPGSGGSSTEH